MKDEGEGRRWEGGGGQSSDDCCCGCDGDDDDCRQKLLGPSVVVQADGGWVQRRCGMGVDDDGDENDDGGGDHCHFTLWDVWVKARTGSRGVDDEDGGGGRCRLTPWKAVRMKAEAV